MDVSEGDQAGRPDGRENGPSETVEFGGLPFRWPLAERVLRRLPRMPRLPSARGVALGASAISLGVGLLIGLGTGHFVFGPTGGKAPEASGNSAIASGNSAIEPRFMTAIGTTGARCAVQDGEDLQLGIQLVNESDLPVTLDRISNIFPMRGLQDISGGVGACGVLPPSIGQPYPLLPGGTEWIVTTVAVHVACPQPDPVWFKVDYSVGSRKVNVVIAAFPDLGPVHFGHCATS